MRDFDHTRPVRNRQGCLIGKTPCPATTRTRQPLNRSHGKDGGKRLVVSLQAGDIISLRPEHTRRCLTITAQDLYAELLRRKAAKYAFDKRQKKY